MEDFFLEPMELDEPRITGGLHHLAHPTHSLHRLTDLHARHTINVL
jgi:hypothetical protein